MMKRDEKRWDIPFLSTLNTKSHVAQGASAMWTHVHVPQLADASEQAIKRVLAHLSHVIALSGRFHIDVCARVAVTCYKPSSYQDTRREDAFHARLFTMLMRESRRIRTCAIYTGGNRPKEYDIISFEKLKGETKLVNHIVHLLRCPTPHLLELDVHCEHTTMALDEDFWQGFPEQEFPQLLPDAPNVRHIRVDKAPIFFRRPHPGLPALRSLALHDIYPFDVNVHIWDTLSIAPNIEDLTLDYLCNSSAAHPPQPLTSLPALKSLDLRQEGYSDIRPGIVETPNLASLTADGFTVAYYVVSESLSRSLKSIDLACGGINQDGWEILRQLTALETAELELEDRQGNNDMDLLLAALLDQSDPMWPRLRDLSICEYGADYSVSNEVVCDNLIRLGHVRGSAMHSDENLVRPLERLKLYGQLVPPPIALQLQEILGDRFVYPFSE